ncbi:hypothetical protein XENTR_v10022859 [Xenopus tropicalis]|uniref:Tuftelin 1 n=1 Tax=Xenopus tropicalis TaxID=8364 RepID=A0A6I8RT14_XENTR|nr:tuftelin isoform X1 [Xenopus tropicalis]KAE8589021.1 hypothetical protein XENTR_v10022859 [Xenopus tropicalis]
MADPDSWSLILGPWADHTRTVRLTLREDSPERNDPNKVKPVGRAFALISSRPLRGSPPLNSELIKSKDGDEEIIKVYLKAKAQEKANHEWNVSQLRNEVRQIQEARTSLQNLREDITSGSQNSGERDPQPDKVHVERQNGLRRYGDSWRGAQAAHQEEEFPLDNGKDMRQTAQRLFAKLQEAEKRQHADRKMFEEKLSQCQAEAEQNRRGRLEAQENAAERQKEVEELRRLMSGMEKEHQQLLQKMKQNEDELGKMKSQEKQDEPFQERCEELEKTVGNLKEKIHHLDDMLKSQQRKVRQMIEQLQNSRTAMQEKDSVIQELREKVSWLQAENLELQDKLDHFMSNNPGHTSYLSRGYSKPPAPNFKRVYLPPGSGRPFPLIKLVET